MPTLTDLFDGEDLGRYLAEGLVRRQTHPSLPLAVLNYTEVVQYGSLWDCVTEQCRGLIYNTDTNEVVARPWRKFHNWDQSQVGKIPTGPMIKAPKVDGSLGILYETPDEDPRLSRWAIASRGSFASEQAIQGTSMFLPTAVKHGFRPLEGRTYLFEILYPTNRIVVNYGDFRGLVLLDVLDLETCLPDFAEFDECPWPYKAEKTSVPGGFSDSLVHEIGDNEEGFVLYWPGHDLRVKMKGATYVSLHRVLTQANARTVWEYLSTGRSTEDLLQSLDVPDEFYGWLRQTTVDLEQQFGSIELECLLEWGRVMAPLFHEEAEHHQEVREFRKAFALAVKDFKYKSVLFRMLDDKPFDDLIWKVIRPEATKPFWNQGEN